MENIKHTVKIGFINEIGEEEFSEHNFDTLVDAVQYARAADKCRQLTYLDIYNKEEK